MKPISPIYIILGLTILIISVICFWLISKKTPKGTLLGLAIAMWVIGQIVGSQSARELKIIGGAMATLGSIGFILGLIDLFRKRKAEVEKKE